MIRKLGSIIGFGIAVLGILYLFEKDWIFSINPITIVIQICAIGLMIWARVTFGLRSFHLIANATKGELITTGPYRWLRHPIYASIIYFSIASVISFPYLSAIATVILISGGLYLRMILEEKSLLLSYDNYEEYSKHTKRIIPFIF